MKGLTETQCEELIDAVFTGNVDFCDLLVLGHFIYERRRALVPLASADAHSLPRSIVDERLLKRVDCPSEQCAHSILSAISHLPGCPKH